MSSANLEVPFEWRVVLMVTGGLGVIGCGGPVLVDPGGRLGAVAWLAVIEAGDGFVGIGAAVEDDDRSVGLLGLDDEVEGKEGSAMALEAGGPVFRKEDHARANAMGEVGLRWRKVGEGPVLFLEKLFVDKGVFVGMEAKDGGVPNLWAASGDAAHSADPIVDDGNFFWFESEEGIEWTTNDDVEVEEKGGA